MQLSICMMVKNEEKRLDECLESLKPILEALESELIIVDTGSDDSTVEIAKRHTDKVYFHKWEDDFSGMRNITLSYASGKWVFLLDGDEVLEDAQPIIDFINSDEIKRYNTATVKIKNLTSEDGTGHIMITGHRIFKKDKDFKYRGKIHNQACYKLPIKDIDTTIIHYGYIADDKELMERKFKRTSTILKNELKKEPENLYYLYQLSESYGMYGDSKEALEFMMKAYSLTEAKKLDKKKYLYIIIGAAKWNIHNMNLKEAEEILKQVLDLAGDYIDVQYYLGYSLYLQNKNKKSIPHLERYIELMENFHQLESSKDINIKHESFSCKDKVYELLMTIYYEIEEYEKVIELYKKIKEIYIIKRVQSFIINSYLNLKKYKEMHNYYLNLKNNDKEELSSKVIDIIEIKIKDSNDDNVKKLSYLFCDDNTDYSILCKVRIALIDENHDEDLIDDIYSLDLNELPGYYSDILLYLLEYKLDIVPYVIDSYEEKLNEMMIYLISRFSKDNEIKMNMLINRVGIIEGKIQKLGETVLEYIKYFENKEMQDIEGSSKIEYYRLYKALSRYPLAAYKLEDSLYLKLFEKYIYYGRLYINSIYKSSILDAEKPHHLKNEEDGFLMYIDKAMKIKETNQVEYVRYLGKALNIFELKKGIEFLLEEVEHENNKVNPEMEALKSTFKENIKVFIEKNIINEAETLINEYEKMVTDDIEILLFKSQISVLKLEGDNRLNHKM